MKPIRIFTLVVFAGLFLSACDEKPGPGQSVIGRKPGDMEETTPARSLSGQQSNTPESDAVNVVRVTNQTGYDIYFLEISPTTATDWTGAGSDVLDSDQIIPNGSTVAVKVSGHGRLCTFDVRATDLEDDTYSMMDVDLCTDNTLTFSMDHFDEKE